MLRNEHAVVVLEREEKTSSSTVGEKVTYDDHMSEKLKTQMRLVEALEPHDRAYFTAFLVDIHKSGK